MLADISLLILTYALSILTIVGLIKLLNKMSYPLGQRYLHCRFILGIILFGILMTNRFTISYLMLGIDKIINSRIVNSAVSFLLPDRGYDLQYIMLMIVALNLCVVLSVSFMLFIIKKIWSNTDFIDYENYFGLSKILHLHWKVAGIFYYDSDNGYEPHQKCYVIAKWLKGMKRVFVAIWILETVTIGAMLIFASKGLLELFVEGVKRWYFMPMFAYLLTHQMQLFLESENDFMDYAGSIGTEEIKQHWSGKNIENLRKITVDIFRETDALLHTEYRLNNEVDYDKLADNMVSNTQKEFCDEPNILAALSKQISDCGIEQNNCYQNALTAMLDGKSINVRDCFEGDFLIYLAAYLNFFLAQGKRAVIICGQANRAGYVKDVFEKAFRRVNTLDKIWRVSAYRDINEEDDEKIDVLVCSYKEFIDYSAKYESEEFFNELFCCTFIDGYGIFSQGPIQTEMISQTLKKIKTDVVVYVVFSYENNDSLRTVIEKAIGRELLAVERNAGCNNCSIAIWKEEGFYKIQRAIGIGSETSCYIGAAIPLALVAIKMGFPKVHVIPAFDRGDSVYKQDCITQLDEAIGRYLDCEADYKNAITLDSGDAIKPSDISEIIAYDESYNFYNALTMWQKYGGNSGTFINVISPQYLLRDYFADNFTMSAHEEFNALIPYKQGLKVTNLAILLAALSCNEFSENDLLRKADDLNLEYDNLEDLLENCLRECLKIEHFGDIYAVFGIHMEKGRRYIKVVNDGIRNEIRRLIQTIEIKAKNGECFDLPVMTSTIYNHYLPGMIAAFNGRLYRINDIKINDNYIDAVQESNLQTLYSYYQISEFVFGSMEKIGSETDINSVKLQMYRGETSRKIYGFWSNNKGNEFVNKTGIRINDMREQPIKCTFNDAVVLQIKFLKDKLGENPKATLTAFAYIFAELSKTLFPATYKNLFVAISSEMNDSGSNLAKTMRYKNPEDIIKSLIPWVDRKEDDEKYLSVYVVEASSLGYGMPDIIKDKISEIFTLINKYLKWYIEKDKSLSVSASFLNFGWKKVPEIFDINGVYNLLHQFVPEYGDVNQSHKTINEGLPECTCTFCGRTALFVNLLEDGRMMCRECQATQTSQKEEIKNFYIEMKKFMEQGWGITLRNKIHLRFQSAETIRKACKAPEPKYGRVVGYYVQGKNLICIESRGPRNAVKSTLMHELTHLWQFDNLDITTLRKKLEDDQFRVLVEGHATFVTLEGMRQRKEARFADRLEASIKTVADEYSVGLKFIKAYMSPKMKESESNTPFSLMKELVDKVLSGSLVVPKLKEK